MKIIKTSNIFQYKFLNIMEVFKTLKNAISNHMAYHETLYFYKRISEKIRKDPDIQDMFIVASTVDIDHMSPEGLKFEDYPEELKNHPLFLKRKIKAWIKKIRQYPTDYVECPLDVERDKDIIDLKNNFVKPWLIKQIQSNEDFCYTNRPIRDLIEELKDEDFMLSIFWNYWIKKYENN